MRKLIGLLFVLPLFTSCFDVTPECPDGDTAEGWSNAAVIALCDSGYANNLRPAALGYQTVYIVETNKSLAVDYLQQKFCDFESNRILVPLSMETQTIPVPVKGDS